MGTALRRPTALTALGAAVAAALAPLYADGGAARPANWWLWATIPAAVLALAVLTAVRDGRRSMQAAAGLLALAGAVLAGWLLVLDLNTGTPGGILVVPAICAVVIVVAMLIAAIRPDRARSTPVHDPEQPASRRRPARWALLALPLTIAVITGAGLLVAPVARALPENSVTAASVTIPAVPHLPTRRAWQTPAPKAAASFFYDGGVVAAGAGFVTALGYPGAPSPGLAGVDGATGKLRWTYDLGPSRPAGLVASPDGSYVLAVFDPHNGRRGPASRLVALDAMTGRPLWSRVVQPGMDSSNLAPTATTLALFADDLVPAGDVDTLLGIDLATGDVRWRARPASGCRFATVGAASTAKASLQSERCDDGTARLVALDQQTGAEKWRYTTDVDAAGGDSGEVPANWGVMDQVNTDPTGTLVKLHRIVSGLPHLTDVLLRGSDGQQMASVKVGQLRVDGPVAVITESDREGLLRPDDTALEAMQLSDTDGCGPVIPRLVTTDTALVRVCQDGSGADAFLLVQPAEPGSEVTRIDLDTEPQVLLAAPGALVTANVTRETVTYTGYRDA